PLVIDEAEAFTFCANSVVVDDVVVMPAGVPVRVARRLERWGFTVATVDVSELHKGGGSIRCMTLPLDTRLDAARLHRDLLSLAYTPGVARVCTTIAEHPDTVWDLTWKSHVVAVVTDGSAVLGLGDIGPAAALPVMEGKAVLFKEFGGID